MKLLGLNLKWADHFTIRIDTDGKLKNADEYQLLRFRPKELNHNLNKVEKFAFASTNSSLRWIGIATSPFCSLYGLCLQQKVPDLMVCRLIEQANILRKLKVIRTCMSYPGPTNDLQYVLRALAFVDVSKPSENDQLGVLVGLLLREIRIGSMFHHISWISHKSKRFVKSVSLPKILAGPEGTDEWKMIVYAYMSIWPA